MDVAATAAGADRFMAYVEALTSVIGHADRALPLRDYCAVDGGRPQAVAQPVEIGQIAGIEIGSDGVGEFSLASAIVRECQETDHGAAGLLLAFSRQQRLEGACIPNDDADIAHAQRNLAALTSVSSFVTYMQH